MSAAADNALQKIRMMERSTRCLVYGTLSMVLPLIGPFFALAAALESGSARRLEKSYWNPARPHRMIGVTLAYLSALTWGMFDAFIVFQIIWSALNGPSD